MSPHRQVSASQTSGAAIGRKPRLLFLAYRFPPQTTIGCVRAYNMAKWLTQKGWEVTVVTPQEFEGVRAEASLDVHLDLSRQGIRCIRTEHHWRPLLTSRRTRGKHAAAWVAGGVLRRSAALLGIEREAGWIEDAARACAGLTASGADVILASGPPFVSFGLAKRLSEQLGRPYVLDYRDLWTKNPHATRRVRERAIGTEREVLDGSVAALGVSPSLVESLREQFGSHNALNVISNGFDPEELARIPRHDFGHFAIVYTGIFYPPKRGVEPLMAALQLVDGKSGGAAAWAFHYYGPQADYVRGAAADFHVDHRVRVHGKVSRAEALAAVRGANVAVVISSIYEHASLQDKGIVTGKVFDAIGVGAPLLVIAPEGSDLEGILAVTGLGARFAGTEIDRIAQFLGDRMKGGLPLAFNPEPYSWANIVERLDGFLREIVSTMNRGPVVTGDADPGSRENLGATWGKERGPTAVVAGQDSKVSPGESR